jgi:hypothetical protein
MDEENVFIYNGVLLSIKKNAIAGCWLLTPVILTTQEAEIRRIMVQG